MKKTIVVCALCDLYWRAHIITKSGDIFIIEVDEKFIDDLQDARKRLHYAMKEIFTVILPHGMCNAHIVNLRYLQRLDAQQEL